VFPLFECHIFRYFFLLCRMKWVVLKIFIPIAGGGIHVLVYFFLGNWTSYYSFNYSSISMWWGTEYEKNTWNWREKDWAKGTANLNSRYEGPLISGKPKTALAIQEYKQKESVIKRQISTQKTVEEFPFLSLF